MSLFRRKKRHEHTWTEWKLIQVSGVHLKTGVASAWDAQRRRCTECGYTEQARL